MQSRQPAQYLCFDPNCSLTPKLLTHAEEVMQHIGHQPFRKLNDIQDTLKDESSFVNAFLNKHVLSQTLKLIESEGAELKQKFLNLLNLFVEQQKRNATEVYKLRLRYQEVAELIKSDNQEEILKLEEDISYLVDREKLEQQSQVITRVEDNIQNLIQNVQSNLQTAFLQQNQQSRIRALKVEKEVQTEEIKQEAVVDRIVDKVEKQYSDRIPMSPSDVDKQAIKSRKSHSTNAAQPLGPVDQVSRSRSTFEEQKVSLTKPKQSQQSQIGSVLEESSGSDQEFQPISREPSASVNKPKQEQVVQFKRTDRRLNYWDIVNKNERAQLCSILADHFSFSFADTQKMSISQVSIDISLQHLQVLMEVILEFQPQSLELDLHGLQLTNISFLSALKDLQKISELRIDLYNNSIVSIQPLVDFKGLQNLVKLELYLQQAITKSTTYSLSPSSRVSVN